MTSSGFESENNLDAVVESNKAKATPVLYGDVAIKVFGEQRAIADRKLLLICLSCENKLLIL
jgi:hypothetical protein